MAIPRTDLDRGSRLVSHVLLLLGFGLVGVGAVLPWVDKEIPVQVYVLGEQMGVERVWVRWMLVGAGVGALLEVGRFVTSDWRSVLDFVLVGIGGLIAVIAVADSPLTGRWTPGPGVYITLLGGILVVLGAGISLVTTYLDSDPGALRSVGE